MTETRRRDAAVTIGAITTEARKIRDALRGIEALEALDLTTLEVLVALEEAFRAALTAVARVEVIVEWNEMGEGYKVCYSDECGRGLTMW